MTHRSAVVGNAPERVFGSVGADEAEGVERIDGAVASPFAAISATGKDYSLGSGVFVDSANSNIECLVDGAIARSESLCR